MSYPMTQFIKTLVAPTDLSRCDGQMNGQRCCWKNSTECLVLDRGMHIVNNDIKTTKNSSSPKQNMSHLKNNSSTYQTCTGNNCIKR